MRSKNKRFFFWLISSLLFALFFFVQYNASFSVKIGLANPMLPLLSVLTVSMFAGELPSVIFALFCGMITDGAAGTPVCFNTIVMILLSLAVSLITHYLFNNNIRSAITVGITGTFIYYFLRLIFVFSASSLTGGVRYLLMIAVPSVIYSTVIIIPVYYLERRLYKKYYLR